jgi:hypothetical protein
MMELAVPLTEVLPSGRVRTIPSKRVDNEATSAADAELVLTEMEPVDAVDKIFNASELLSCSSLPVSIALI